MQENDARRLLCELFRLLPPPGAVWPEERRHHWLTAAEAIFRLIYPEPDMREPTRRRSSPAEADR